ncbi:glycoside hydrolase [Niabella sp. CC-SYL272]|uniref:sialidase family protein n=1 Tax=Niabella agricola TaxID=2891571 RepID=UPI001F264FCC|nr:sialidase family protein [Niabella agricola]MCF3109375.1 glycoside hydrolase [Niabella agricola]
MKSTLQYRTLTWTGLVRLFRRSATFFLGTLLLTASLQANAQKDVPVFIAGREGHKNYRIPAIIRLPSGKLLAFAEGRVHNAGDFGDINIVLKTSDDNGNSWSPLKVVVDEGLLQAGNPAPVVDLTDPMYPAGRIFLFYNTGNNHEGEVRKGNGLREVWYKTSADGGLTWSSAVNITLQTHRPRQPEINPQYNFPEDWRSYANTPGHAMQFIYGAYRGRIYVAANHSAGSPLPRFKDYRAHGFYTDDHGKTFHISNNVNLEGGNENMAAEISKGRLMLNLRNQQGHVKARFTAISGNGGVSWQQEQFDRNLPDPVCQGSLLTIGKNRGKSILAFCNNADTLQRNHLTLRISKNDGKSWTKKIPVCSQEKKGDVTGYSDIVKISAKKIGVLYERNQYTEILFTVVQW